MLAALLLILLLLASASCTRGGALTAALEQAGTNRAELGKVLLHYDSVPEKKKAAEFLIQNMPGQCSLQGPFLLRYYELLDSLQGLEHIGHYVSLNFRELNSSKEQKALPYKKSYVITLKKSLT